jgi:hypothetical protein
MASSDRWGKPEAAEDSKKPPERRIGQRLDKVFPVFLECDRGGGFGVARNISEGGMFVETRDPAPLGSQVRITFPSQGGEMTAVAEVRYLCHLFGQDGGWPVAVRGMGVRFLYFEAALDASAVLH